jgi:hypothetical protein
MHDDVMSDGYPPADRINPSNPHAERSLLLWATTQRDNARRAVVALLLMTAPPVTGQCRELWPDVVVAANAVKSYRRCGSSS